MTAPKKATFEEATQHLIGAKITHVEEYTSDPYTTIESVTVETLNDKRFLISRDQWNSDATEIDVEELDRPQVMK